MHPDIFENISHTSLKQESRIIAEMGSIKTAVLSKEPTDSPSIGISGSMAGPGIKYFFYDDERTRDSDFNIIKNAFEAIN